MYHYKQMNVLLTKLSKRVSDASQDSLLLEEYEAHVIFSGD